MNDIEEGARLFALATALFLFGIMGSGAVIAIVGSWVVAR